MPGAHEAWRRVACDTTDRATGRHGEGRRVVPADADRPPRPPHPPHKHRGNIVEALAGYNG